MNVTNKKIPVRAGILYVTFDQKSYLLITNFLAIDLFVEDAIV